MSAGPRLSVFTDEMISPRLAADLLLRGYDVLRRQAAGRANRNISDEDQLTSATTLGRAIYTFNSADFAALSARWQNEGRTHAGIIVSVDLNADPIAMLARLQRHLETVTPSAQRGRLMILWPPP